LLVLPSRCTHFVVLCVDDLKVKLGARVKDFDTAYSVRVLDISVEDLAHPEEHRQSQPRSRTCHKARKKFSHHADGQ
jgi:hypothetical protein